MTKEEVIAKNLEIEQQIKSVEEQISSLKLKIQTLSRDSVNLWTEYFNHYINKKVRLTAVSTCGVRKYEGYFGGCENSNGNLYPIVYKIKKNGEMSCFKEGIWEHINQVTNIELI